MIFCTDKHYVLGWTQGRELLTLGVYAAEVLYTSFPLVIGKNEKNLNFCSAVLEDVTQETDFILDLKFS